MPYVSVGMPVYNGEAFIRRSLDSLLAQTFRDFEIVVCDNASVDRTREICTDFAHKDSRIKYHRNESNIGAAGNFNRVFELSTGRYFTWAGHDDHWSADYLKRCVEELEQYPSAILCYCQEIYYDDDGNVVCYYRNPHDVNSRKAGERFRQMLWSQSRIDPVYAVIRREVLQRTALVRDILGADDILALELSLIGPFHFVAEPLAFRRAHPRRNAQERLVRIDPTRRHVHFAFTRRCVTYVRLVMSAPLGALDRIFLILDILRFFADRQLRRRSRDVVNRLQAFFAPASAAASRFVDGELRLKAFRRLARTASWGEFEGFLANLPTTAPPEIWKVAARELASNWGDDGAAVLRAWLFDWAECRRFAAVAIMKEDPRRWMEVLSKRHKIEPISTIRRLIEAAIVDDAPLRDGAENSVPLPNGRQELIQATEA